MQDDKVVTRVNDFEDFGKGILKVYRAHPDAFVQAAVQLAYFRCHGKYVALIAQNDEIISSFHKNKN